MADGRLRAPRLDFRARDDALLEQSLEDLEQVHVEGLAVQRARPVR